MKVHKEGSSEQQFGSIQEMATFSEYRYPVKDQEISKIQFFKDQARQNDILAWVEEEYSEFFKPLSIVVSFGSI